MKAFFDRNLRFGVGVCVSGWVVGSLVVLLVVDIRCVDDFCVLMVGFRVDCCLVDLFLVVVGVVVLGGVDGSAWSLYQNCVLNTTTLYHFPFPYPL